jgi:NADPH:quinone reductase-like Zn-dependent oxidoreductase
MWFTYLRQGLGASKVVDRLTVSKKALQTETWAAVVDSVGGETLVQALTQTVYGGAVAACGVAGGPALKVMTV